MKKIVCLDFDGVIHSYTSGWQGVTKIPDEPVRGAVQWIFRFLMKYCKGKNAVAELHIFSSRSRSRHGRQAMRWWLNKHGLPKWCVRLIKFPVYKPAAMVTIDDRAIQFTGKFPDPEELLNFQPWNKQDV